MKKVLTTIVLLCLFVMPVQLFAAESKTIYLNAGVREDVLDCRYQINSKNDDSWIHLDLNKHSIKLETTDKAKDSIYYQYTVDGTNWSDIYIISYNSNLDKWEYGIEQEVLKASSSSNDFDIVLPESFASFTIGGNLASYGLSSSELNCENNIFELTYTPDTDVLNYIFNADIDFNYFKQMEDSELEVVLDDASLRYEKNGNADQQTANVNFDLAIDYTKYIPSNFKLPTFANVSFNSEYMYSYNSNSNPTQNLLFNAGVLFNVGLGRVYSVNNVYRAKLMMEELGVVPTDAKIEAVADILNKLDRLEDFYLDNSVDCLPKVDSSVASYKTIYDYYQALADAMDISERVDEVIVLNNWSTFEDLNNRAKYIDIRKGWDLKLGVGVGDDFFETGDHSFSSQIQTVDLVLADKLYYDVTLNINTIENIISSDLWNIYCVSKLIYLPNSPNLWVEGIARINYNFNSIWGDPFTIDTSVAAHTLIGNKITFYGGLNYRYITKGVIGAFAGGKFSLL